MTGWVSLEKENYDMKKIVGVVLLSIVCLFNVTEARYRAIFDSARDKIVYEAKKKASGFSKQEMISVCKEISTNGEKTCYVLITFQGKGMGARRFGNIAKVETDNKEYLISRNIQAVHILKPPHIAFARAEFILPLDVAEDIVSGNTLVFKFYLDDKEKNIVISDSFVREIQFVLSLDKEDYLAVCRKEIRPLLSD